MNSMQFLWRTGTSSSNLQLGGSTDVLSAGLLDLMKCHPSTGLVEMKVLTEKNVTGSWWYQRASSDLIAMDPKIISCRTVALGVPTDPSLRSLPIHTLPSQIHLGSLFLCRTHLIHSHHIHKLISSWRKKAQVLQIVALIYNVILGFC